MAGPFKDMIHGGVSVGSVADPKLLGTYEMELFPTLFEWRTIPFRTIIDVGAAEGYYAVGLSLLFPKAKIIAFESTESGRILLREIADLNGVTSRIELHGHCDIETLREEARCEGPLLLIMDIEGGERDLLNIENIPSLRAAHIIVELHDVLDPGVGELIKRRLSKSHDLQEIWTRKREYNDFSNPRQAILKGYLMPYLKQYADEGRPGPMSWLICTPKKS